MSIRPIKPEALPPHRSDAGFRREVLPLGIWVDDDGGIMIWAPGTSADPQVPDESVTISPDQVDLLIRWLRDAAAVARRKTAAKGR